MRRGFLLWACLLLTSLVMVAQASEYNRYVEDFSTTTYRDDIWTSARWDTDRGELGLSWYAPRVVETASTYDTAYDLVVDGDYAFVADGSNGVRVFSVADPESLALVGGFDPAGYVLDVDVAGDRMYLAGSGAGLYVLDISDPASPALMGSYNTSGSASGVQVAGDLAYVADGSGGLAIVDVSNSGSPSLVGTYATGGDAREVVVAGNAAYVACYTAGLRIIDVSDPSSPTLLSSVSTTDNAQGIAVDGDVAYIAVSSRGVFAYEVSDPSSPSYLGSLDPGGSAKGVTVCGDYLYVANGTSGVVVMDVSDPSAPETHWEVDTGGSATRVAIEGLYAYVADGPTGVTVARIAELTGPWMVGSIPTNAYCADVEVSGDVAYVTDLSGGFHMIDVQDPGSPSLLGSGSGANFYYEVTVDGDNAYLATSRGFLSYDISDPTAVVCLDTLFTMWSTEDVAVVGDRALVITDGGDFIVVDIEDPASLTQLGSVGLPATDLREVVVRGNEAYVVSCNSELFIAVDVSNPLAPAVAGTLACPMWPQGLDVVGNTAYVACMGDLLTVDISNPSAPSALNTLPGLQEFRALQVCGDVLLCAEDRHGLQVADIIDPSAPVLGDICDTPGGVVALDAVGDLVFAADENAGLAVLQAFQRAWGYEAASAQSVNLIPLGVGEVTHVRLAADHGDSILWSVSTDYLGTWTDVPPTWEWVELDDPSEQLVWRSRHLFRGGSRGPTCSELTIEWLLDAPIVKEVVDIPNDQGGQVSLTWMRSGFDQVGSSHQITEYAVYRRIDGGAPPALRGNESAPGDARLYPPGEWHYVTSVPACAEDEYSVVVPTLVDSTAGDGIRHSVFFVRALTETTWVSYDAPPDSGYSVDNLVPHVPEGFRVDYGPGGNILAWEAPGDPDLLEYRIYRGTDPGFTPVPSNLVHTTQDLSWLDEAPGGTQYVYLISAVDRSGNESAAAAPEETTGAPAGDAPRAFALHQNAPNPFNPVTTIAYDVPAPGGHVRVAVYDVAGRLVRTLVDSPQEPGSLAITWDGTDERGARVASGVYYCRMQAADYDQMIKMTVLK